MKISDLPCRGPRPSFVNQCSVVALATACLLLAHVSAFAGIHEWTSSGGNPPRSLRLNIPASLETGVIRGILIHGNGVSEPDKIAEMVRRTRLVPGYFPKPVLFNEDDHFNFNQPNNNFTAAVSEYASWGYFDFRMKGEGFDEGYQSVPVNWRISSDRKRGFFRLLAEITGSRP